MFFVPMGILKNKDWFTDVKVTDEHIEVMRRCLWHSVHWGEKIIGEFYLKNPKYFPLKWMLQLFLKYAAYRGRSIENKLGLAPLGRREKHEQEVLAAAR
jgi:hypothetical protein